MMSANEARRFIWNKRILVGAMAFALGAADTAEAQEVSFNIPAESLSQALRDYGRAAGRQLIFTEDLVRGHAVAALRGSFTADQALTRLLQGSGLTAEVSDRGAIMIVKARVRGASTPGSDDAEAGQAVQTVVVTAQKREQNAFDVPITLTAFTRDRLDAAHITTLEEVSQQTPTFVVASYDVSEPSVAIRGATNTSSLISGAKPIAVILDDVFIPRYSAALFDLYALDQITVLQGPQGTILGPNSEGGAVMIQTRKPSLAVRTAEIQAGYGNYDSVDVDAYVSTPLGDSTAVNLAVSDRQNEGYGRDALSGRRQDDLDSHNVRGEFLFQPDERFQALTSIDYSRDTNNGRTLAVDPSGPLTQADSAVNLGIYRPHVSEVGLPQSFAREIWGVSERLRWRLDTGVLTSITAYRQSESGEDYAQTALNYRLLQPGNVQVEGYEAEQPKTLTQDVNFASNAGQRFDYLLGLDYLHQDSKAQDGAVSYAAQTGSITSSNLAVQSASENSFALFADATVHVLPRWDVTAGVRWTTDSKSATERYMDFVDPGYGFLGPRQSKTWSQTTPRAVVTYSPLDNTRLFASVTQGFMAGGFNTTASGLSDYYAPLNPETVTSYELGSKSKFLQNRIEVAATLFQADYKNKQEYVYNAITNIGAVVNAAQATSKGAELQITLRPTENLNLNGAYGALYTDYNKYINGAYGPNTGHQLPFSPHNTVSFSSSYVHGLGEMGTLRVVGSYSYTDAFYTDGGNGSERVGSYGLFNASLIYTPRNSRWRISLWGKNLGDKTYDLTPTHYIVDGASVAPPRSYGVLARWAY
jgi:iron complex outermembrane receptor protein